MKVLEYEMKVKLYNSYFDVNDHITPKAVLNIFQDVAATHAELINIGYEDLLKNNLYWVLSRVKYDIIKMPKPDEEVIIKTWPHEKGKIDFDRDMLVTSLNGELLIKGTTKWCVIDVSTRMLQRTTNIIYNGICSEEKNYQERFNKISIPDVTLSYKFTYQVNYSDIDHNHHMNNTNYAIPIINAIENKNISHFEINYLTECLLNDKMEIYSYRYENKEVIMGIVNNNKVFTSLTY